MNNYLKKRSLYTFTSFVFGFALLFNLMRLSVEITGTMTLYPYMYVMFIAAVLSMIGFLLVKPQLLSFSTITWIVAIAFNIAAIIFIIPIVILNIIGRNKVLQVIDLEQELKKENND